MTRAPSTLVCTVTPFDAGGALDEAALRLLIDRYGKAGVGAFLGTSSPGEGFALSPSETEQLYAVAKETMAGRAPVRAMGVEPHNTGETLALIKTAESVGLDAMQLYCLDCSHGSQPTMVELERFFRATFACGRSPQISDDEGHTVLEPGRAPYVHRLAKPFGRRFEMTLIGQDFADVVRRPSGVDGGPRGPFPHSG